MSVGDLSKLVYGRRSAGVAGFIWNCVGGVVVLMIAVQLKLLLNVA